MKRTLDWNKEPALTDWQDDATFKRSAESIMYALIPNSWKPLDLESLNKHREWVYNQTFRARSYNPKGGDNHDRWEELGDSSFSGQWHYSEARRPIVKKMIDDLLATKIPLIAFQEPELHYVNYYKNIPEDITIILVNILRTIFTVSHSSSVN
jgi:hypothetical protein